MTMLKLHLPRHAINQIHEAIHAPPNPRIRHVAATTFQHANQHLQERNGSLDLLCAGHVGDGSKDVQ